MGTLVSRDRKKRLNIVYLSSLSDPRNRVWMVRHTTHVEGGGECPCRLGFPSLIQLLKHFMHSQGGNMVFLGLRPDETQVESNWDSDLLGIPHCWLRVDQKI